MTVLAKTADHLVEFENGVLTTGSVDTAGIGLATGATAQVDVDLPTLADDDDDYLADDDVVIDTPTSSFDASGAVDAEIVEEEAAPASGSIPTTRREAHHHDEHDLRHAVERVHPRPAEVPLQSRRLGEFEAGRETISTGPPSGGKRSRRKDGAGPMLAGSSCTQRTARRLG